MATVKDYIFDKMARIGNDTCGLSQKNVQNVNAGNYMVQNFFHLIAQWQDPSN